MLTLSNEQRKFIKTVMGGDNILCNAGAGSGKTFTLFQAMRYDKNKTFIILAFNSHLVEEYAGLIKKYRLGKRVTSSTLHTLAKRNTIDKSSIEFNGKTFILKKRFTLKGFFHSRDLQKITKQNGWEVSQELKRFCGNDKNFDEVPSYIYTVFEYAMKNYEITHSMYMKLFTLKCMSGEVDLPYDCLVIDEYQDMEKSVAEVIKNIKAKQKVVVGDRNQAIYEFLLNGFKFADEPFLEDFTKLTLSKSFRCSEHISEMVDRNLLKPYLNPDMTYTGTDTDTTDGTYFFIGRTNNEVLKIAYTLARNNKKFQLKTNLKELSSGMISVFMVMGKADAFKTDFTITSGNINKKLPNMDRDVLKDLKMYLDSNRDIGVISFMREYSSSTVKSAFTLISYLNDKDIDSNEFIRTIENSTDKKSLNTVSTVFKLKGSTADNVKLYKFKSPRELQQEFVLDCIAKYEDDPSGTFEYYESIHSDKPEYDTYLAELMMVYVAITRARHKVSFKSCDEDSYWIDKEEQLQLNGKD